MSNKSTITHNNIINQKDNEKDNSKAKRELLAKAALEREKNWRQKQNPVLTKDKILSKIQQTYKKQGNSEPFGLGSLNLDSLIKHYNSIK